MVEVLRCHTVEILEALGSSALELEFQILNGQPEDCNGTSAVINSSHEMSGEASLGQ